VILDNSTCLPLLKSKGIFDGNLRVFIKIGKIIEEGGMSKKLAKW
jgi:hypothetical protein